MGKTTKVLLGALVTVLIVAGVYFSSTSLNKGALAPLPAGVNCADSDNDTYENPDIYTKGTVRERKTVAGRQIIVNTADACGTTNVLSETSCVNGKLKWKNVRCPVAGTCRSGACARPAPTCTDSDGGNNIFALGTVTATAIGSSTIRGDTCASANSVYEWTCASDGIGGNWLSGGSSVPCGAGNICQDGACVPAPQPTYTCTDWDGEDFFTAGRANGTTTYSDGHTSFWWWLDQCKDANTLNEARCNADNSGTSTAIDTPCQFGCQNGACLPAPVATCTDSDAGLNFYQKGHVTGGMYQGPGAADHSLNADDICTNETTLSENYCYTAGQAIDLKGAVSSALPGGTPGQKYGAWASYNCANEGKACWDGACGIAGTSTPPAGGTSTPPNGTSTPPAQRIFTCTDNDLALGDDAMFTKSSVYGTTTTGDARGTIEWNYTDTCNDPSELYEYKCFDSGPNAIGIQCPNGCTDGACVR